MNIFIKSTSEKKSFSNKIKILRFRIRNLIRNKSKWCFNWLVLSIMEHYNNNHSVARKVFFFCPKNSYDYLEYKKTFLDKFQSTFLKKNLYSQKIWLQLLFQYNYLNPGKRMTILNFAFYIPKSFIIWRIILLHYGFDFLILVRNKNYCISKKEIWMRFCSMKIRYFLIISKTLFFYITFIKIYYTKNFMWFNYLTNSDKLENTTEIELFSKLFNFVVIFQKFYKVNAIVYLKKKYFEAGYIGFLRNCTDLDFLIGKCFSFNVKKLFPMHYDSYILVNFIFLRIFTNGTKLTAFDLKKVRFSDFLSVHEFINNYYPRFKQPKFFFGAWIFSKNCFVCNFKFFKINVEIFFLSTINFLKIPYKYTFLFNNLRIQGFCEKNKELKEIIIKTINLKTKKNSFFFSKLNVYFSIYFYFKLEIIRKDIFLFDYTNKIGYEVIKFTNKIFYKKLTRCTFLVFLISCFFFFSYFKKFKTIIKINQKMLIYFGIVYYRKKILKKSRYFQAIFKTIQKDLYEKSQLYF